MRPLLNKDFRRLRWLLRQEPSRKVRGSSHKFHTCFLSVAYCLHRLLDTRSGVAYKGWDWPWGPFADEEGPTRGKYEDGPRDLCPLFRLKNAFAGPGTRQWDPSRPPDIRDLVQIFR